MSKTGVVSRGREREARDRNGEGAPANLIFVREPIHVAKVATIWNSPGSSSNRAFSFGRKRSEWSLPTEIVSRKLATLESPPPSPNCLAHSLFLPREISKGESRRSIRDATRNKSKGRNIKAGPLCTSDTPSCNFTRCVGGGHKASLTGIGEGFEDVLKFLNLEQHRILFAMGWKRLCLFVLARHMEIKISWTGEWV